MGRPLVFYNCSQSMASSVVKRMLTGMILSGSWVCFEDAHKLSQLMLSILGDYLSSVRQAYQCLMMNANNQYLIRGQSKITHNKITSKVSVLLSRYESVSIVTTRCALDMESPNWIKKLCQFFIIIILRLVQVLHKIF